MLKVLNKYNDFLLNYDFEYYVFSFLFGFLPLFSLLFYYKFKLDKLEYKEMTNCILKEMLK